jgi:DNA-binding response OmpR family regulator
VSPKKILVIEDNHAILDVIMLILEEEKYVVEGLNMGNSLFKKIEEFQPNIIILDIMLPDMDGRAMLKNLKNNISTKNIPVLMISARYNIDNYAINGLKADDFMAKPFDVDDLISKIKALI